MERKAKVEPIRRGSKTVPALSLKGPWLAKLGFPEGCQVVVSASPGKLVLRPEGLETGIQVGLGRLATEMEGFQERLESLAEQVPVLPETQEDAPLALATELLGAVECVLDDDIRPAIRALKDASSLTQAELNIDWSRKRQQFRRPS